MLQIEDSEYAHVCTLVLVCSLYDLQVMKNVQQEIEILQGKNPSWYEFVK